MNSMLQSNTLIIEFYQYQHFEGTNFKLLMRKIRVKEKTWNKKDEISRVYLLNVTT